VNLSVHEASSSVGHCMSCGGPDSPPRIVYLVRIGVFLQGRLCRPCMDTLVSKYQDLTSGS